MAKPVATPVVLIGFDDEGKLTFQSKADPATTLYVVAKVQRAILDETNIDPVKTPQVELYGAGAMPPPSEPKQ